jgi:ferredoxin
MIDITVDGEVASVAEGATILDACRALGRPIPTLCYLETLHPVNACRVCVVELEGSRVLVPSCSRVVTAGMQVRTDTPRVRHSRKMVLEFLASSVDLSTAPSVAGWLADYDCRPDRYGPSASPAAAGGSGPNIFGSWTGQLTQVGSTTPYKFELAISAKGAYVTDRVIRAPNTTRHLSW